MFSSNTFLRNILGSLLFVGVSIFVLFYTSPVFSQGSVWVGGTCTGGGANIAGQSTMMSQFNQTNSNISSMGSTVSSAISAQTGALRTAFANQLADVGSKVGSMEETMSRELTGAGGLSERIRKSIHDQTNALIKNQRTIGLRSSSMPEGSCSKFQQGAAANLIEQSRGAAKKRGLSEIKQHNTSRESSMDSFKAMVDLSNKVIDDQMIFPGNYIFETDSLVDGSGSGSGSGSNPEQLGPAGFVSYVTNPQPVPDLPSNVSDQQAASYRGYRKVYAQQLQLVQKQLNHVQNTYSPTARIGGQPVSRAKLDYQRIFTNKHLDPQWYRNVVTSSNTTELMKRAIFQNNMTNKLLFQINENLKRNTTINSLQALFKVQNETGEKLKNYRDSITDS